eukprot:6365343-Alexandrium_andersonii.AAC.1
MEVGANHTRQRLKHLPRANMPSRRPRGGEIPSCSRCGPGRGAALHANASRVQLCNLRDSK